MDEFQMTGSVLDRNKIQKFVFSDEVPFTFSRNINIQSNTHWRYENYHAVHTVPLDDPKFLPGPHF
jgi:hypothetical protein